MLTSRGSCKHPIRPAVRSAQPKAMTMKKAMKKPKEDAIGQVKPKAKKNREFDELGFQYGRIHMEKQDFNKLVYYRSKAMKRRLPAEEGNSVEAKVSKDDE